MNNEKEYNLKHSTIIVHYNVNEGEPIGFDINLPHGHFKENYAVYRPTTHSVKQTCKEIAETQKRPPRFIADEFDEAEDLITRLGDSTVPRNATQIYNFKASPHQKKGRG